MSCKIRPTISATCDFTTKSDGIWKVNGLARLIHRAIEVIPLAFHLDIRLVHAPAHPHRALTPMKRFFQLGTVFHNPALDGRVVDGHSTLLQEFFDMTIAQGVRQIPPYTHQNDVLWEMGPLDRK